MHEKDALLFIEIVLDGFFDRNFNLGDHEYDRLKELSLDKIKQFIKDKEPHWVKEKSLDIIYQIETAENSIKSGIYSPTSAEVFLDSLLRRTKEKITNAATYYQLEDNKGKTHIFVELPEFP